MHAYHFLTPPPCPQTVTRLDRRVSYKEKEARVLELIEDVGLDGKEDQRVGVRALLRACELRCLYGVLGPAGG